MAASEESCPLKYGAADLVTATFVQRPNWPGKKKKGVQQGLDTILAQKSKIIMIVTILYYYGLQE